jgi:hypothetical protein
MSHGCAYGTNAEGGAVPQWPSYMVDASAAQNRAMEWVTFLEKGTGELYYQTAQALGSAWTDQYQFAGNGDGTLFYPGTTNVIGGSTDVPVASIRLKLIRLGVQDFEWLKMVSDAGDPAFAQQVARALMPNAHAVPADGSAFERARLQLISRYLELTGKSAPAAAQGSPPADPSASSVQSGSDPTTTVGDTASGATAAQASGDDGSGGCVSGSGELSIVGGLLGLAGLVFRKKRR